MIEVGDDQIYAILADEYTNVEGNELMTIFIWYISCLSGEISERMIGTVKLDNTSSTNLLKTVVNLLKRAHLNVEQSRAQGYDGASNMSGRMIGLAALVLKNRQLSIFTTTIINSI